MSFGRIKSKDSAYIAPTYNRFQVALKSGKGATLVGENGKKYIDFTSGIGVNIFGVNDKSWKKAVTSQLKKIQHACNLYYTEPQVTLAELLCEKTGAKKVFFGNSGAEANECAIKVARKYSSDKYGEGKRYEIITLKDSFHGRTLATLSATGQDGFHHHFGPFVDGFRYAEPTMESIIENTTSKTCAVMVEPIQGESGVRVLDKEFLVELAKYCKQKDILLIIDEVQTGNGRTGTAYAFEQYGIKPDVMTTAKGLGGGLPIGACLFFEKTEKVYGFGDHGTTFGGNPVACAAGVNVMERLTDSFLESVRKKGSWVREYISALPCVKEVTGKGLMIGIKVDAKSSARTIAEKCAKKGLLILTAHDRLRLLPPLNITDRELDKGLKILHEVLLDEAFIKTR